MQSSTGRSRCRSGNLAWPAVLIFLMAAAAYTYWIPRGALANADTRIALTRAIVDDHTLQIDRYAAGLSDRSAYDGHYYTDKSPAVSLLAVPAYAVLHLVLAPAFFWPGLSFMVRYLLTCATISVPAALFVVVAWRFLLPLLGRRRAALLAAAYAFGTMAWALSSLMFSHILTADALFGAFVLLYPALDGKADATPGRLAGAGALCGLAVFLEYPAALVAAVLAVAAGRITVGRDGRRAVPALACFGACALAALAPLAVYNAAVYGSPLSQGYAHLQGAAQFKAGMSRGLEGVGAPSLAALWGITFSPYRGIFFLSPFLLLALPGLARMWRVRRHRSAALICGSAVAATFLFNCCYRFWDGGVSLGPRQSSAALLFLVFPVAFAIRRARWLGLARALIALSITIVGVSCVTVLIFLPGVADPVVTLALHNLVHGPAQNTWAMFLGLRGATSLAPLAALELGAGLALWRAVTGPRPRDRRRTLRAEPLAA